MTLVRHFICCLFFFFGCVILVPFPVQAQQDNRPRVIIVDASRSMTRDDFRGGIQRWDAARFQVRSYLNELLKDQDKRPTALVTFGHQQSAREAMQRYKTKDSRTVPANTAYCNDVEVMARPAPMNSGRADRLMDMLDFSKKNNQQPGGMTPIIQSLRAAATLMEKQVGGEIVIISDWDTVNCVPKGPEFCEWVQAVFEEFRAEGGTVELRYIFVDPNRTDVSPPNELQGCKPNDSVNTEDDPENGGSAQKLTQQVPVTFDLDFAGRVPVNLPRNHLAGSRLELTGPSTSGIGPRHNGALGQVSLFPGAHDYMAHVFPGSDAEKKFNGTYDVTGAGRVLFPYRAPLLEITLQNHSNQLLANLDIDLTFEHVASPGLNHRTPSAVRTGRHSAVLMPGTYRVTAALGRQRSTKDIRLTEGRDASLVLVLDALPGSSGGGSTPAPAPAPKPNPPIGGSGGSGSGSSSGQGGGSAPTGTGIALTVDLSYGAVDLFKSNASAPKFSVEGVPLAIGQTKLSIPKGRQVITIMEGGHKGEVPIMVVDAPGQIYALSPKPGWLNTQDPRVTRYEISPKDQPGFVEVVSGSRLHATLPSGDYTVIGLRGNDVIGQADVSVTPNKGSPFSF